MIDNPLLPGELPADPTTVQLSHEAMAEHYAMYNVFKGLELATYHAQYDHACALGTLERLRGKTAAWNLEAADPDFDADLVLLDQFIANLRRAGAQPAADPIGCPQPPPDDGSGGDDDGGDDRYQPHHCSAGGGAGNGLVLALVALVLGRRRRGQTGDGPATATATARRRRQARRRRRRRRRAPQRQRRRRRRRRLRRARQRRR